MRTKFERKLSWVNGKWNEAEAVREHFVLYDGGVVPYVDMLNSDCGYLGPLAKSSTANAPQQSMCDAVHLRCLHLHQQHQIHMHPTSYASHRREGFLQKSQSPKRQFDPATDEEMTKKTRFQHVPAALQQYLSLIHI